MLRELPDAFSDLVVAHRCAAPPRPPSKFRVWILTSLALFLVVWPVGEVLPAERFHAVGIDSPYARAALVVALNVSLNSYVAVPLFTSLFGHWLRASRPPFVHKQPWRFFDAGPQTLLGKFALSAAYFIGCAVAWIDDTQK